MAGGGGGEKCWGLQDRQRLSAGGRSSGSSADNQCQMRLPQGVWAWGLASGAGGGEGGTGREEPGQWRVQGPL